MSTERKLYRANAAIWFNKTCRIFKNKVYILNKTFYDEGSEVKVLLIIILSLQYIFPKSCIYSQSAPEDGRNCRPEQA